MDMTDLAVSWSVFFHRHYTKCCMEETEFKAIQWNDELAWRAERKQLDFQEHFRRANFPLFSKLTSDHLLLNNRLNFLR